MAKYNIESLHLSCVRLYSYMLTCSQYMQIKCNAWLALSAAEADGRVINFAGNLLRSTKVKRKLHFTPGFITRDNVAQKTLNF